MRLAIAACIGWFALSGCRPSHDHEAAANAVTAERAEQQKNETLCNDCDGFEGVIFKAEINAAAAAARAGCPGRPVELADRNRSGFRASDYRCR